MDTENPTEVRPATAADVPAMATLLAELFAIEADFAADAATQQKGLRALLAAGNDGCVRVAVAPDGAVVGMVTVQMLISTAEGGPVGLVEDLVVAVGWRDRGVGSALLAAAEAWSRQRGLGRLQLLADRDNAPALAFYAGRGWAKTRLVCLRRATRANAAPDLPTQARADTSQE